MTDQPDWNTLIHKHLDGQATTAEVEALSAQIVGDENVRALYLKAAQLHGALLDETLVMDLSSDSVDVTDPNRIGPVRSFAWPRQIAAALVAGTFVGLLGIGVVWAVGSPKAVVSEFRIAHGDFDSLTMGPIPNQFPVRFGVWQGDPAEVSAQAGENRELRFLKTANISGLPNGPAAACDVFQLVDLSVLRQQGGAMGNETELTLELAAHFRRDAHTSDDEVEKVTGVCHLYLFNAAPESIGNGWPLALGDAVASGSKGISLVPGVTSQRVSASCFVAPEARVAVIHLAANPRRKAQTPTAMGDCYVDDVQLTLTSRPKLPVRVVTLELSN